MFPTFPPLPTDLIDLYLGTDAKAKYFRKHIRYFNCGMAMASMQAKNDATVSDCGPAVSNK